MSSTPAALASRTRRATPSRAQVRGDDVLSIDQGWQAGSTGPAAVIDPSGLDDVVWQRASVPGTAAAVLRAEGRDPTSEDVAAELDGRDWWFRTGFDGPRRDARDELILNLDGIATIAEVWLNGVALVASTSMFAAHAIEVTDLVGERNELVICCRALTPRLAERRTPRARWRTRLVADGNLRWFRTMILGRAPGFAAGPAAVGPWRPVRLEHRRAIALSELQLEPRLAGDDGVLSVRITVRPLAGPAPETGRIIVGTAGSAVSADLRVERPDDSDGGRPDGGAGVTFSGEVRVPGVARWWPHTHGTPTLHPVRLEIDPAPGADGSGGAVVIDAGRVGFRSLAGRPGGGPAGTGATSAILRDGLDLRVNDVAVFARGAVWTPLDIVSPDATLDQLRTALEAVRDAGLNMLRLPGTGIYESPAFHDLCDELGILVWQDLMFANLDYPFADDGFLATTTDEVTGLLAGLAGRPSLAVVCGNSEVEQQVAMLGLDPDLGRGPFFGETVPRLLAAAGSDAVYVPSAPSGGSLPFRVDQGIANYYGVGGYRRPLADARLSGVRFAAECLAFANVPDDELLETMLPAGGGALVAHHPRWKAGVPRDNGSGWDFDDVRDHYLALLYGVEPAELRRVDHGRYLDLSRAVSGEVMAEVFGEWRRAASPSAGGLVLWLRDLVAGAGWGIVDASGQPKVAYHHLRRALAPIAIWMTDEGLNGIDVHVANDGPAPLSARLRIAVYRDREQRVAEATKAIDLAAHETGRWNAEEILGAFSDLSWAYRFGPPEHDLVVATLEADDGPAALGEVSATAAILSQAVRQPVGRRADPDELARLGLEAVAAAHDHGTAEVTVRSRRFADGVRIHAAGFAAADDAFPIEPGGERVIRLHPRQAGATVRGAYLTALNLAGRAAIGTAVVDAAAGPGAG